MRLAALTIPRGERCHLKDCSGVITFIREDYDDVDDLYVGWLECSVCGQVYRDTCRESRAARLFL